MDDKYLEKIVQDLHDDFDDKPQSFNRSIVN